MSSPIIWGGFGAQNLQSGNLVLSNNKTLGSDGPKNYLQNPGFETNQTTGWVLGNVSAQTNNFPSNTSPTFGSGASGSLTLSTVASGQLAGSYSASYASSIANVVGDFLASAAFTIDLEDQAKILNFRFYYSAIAGATNANWSGTSSNTFGVAIWDVANSAWIQPAGCFGMTQNSGVGFCTGTFQTPSNGTSFRICIYTANAPSGATTLYFDDFYLGPQIIPIGAPLTDWVSGGTLSISATGGGTGTKGTIGVDQTWYRRVGSNLEVRMEYRQTAAGGGTLSGDYLFLVPGGYSIDTTKLNAYTTVGGNQNNNAVGVVWLGLTGTSQSANTVSVYDATHVRFQNTNNANFVSSTNYNLAGTALSYNAWFTVPIVGWSSNVQMSSDTDTRVLSFVANSANNAATTSSPVIYTNVLTDTHGGYNVSTGRYTIPISGIFRVTAQISVVGPGCNIRKNGTLYVAGSTSGSVNGANISAELSCSAGDIIDIVPSSNTTPSASATANFFMISRISGPSVIAASETVAMSYKTSAAQSIPNSATTVVKFDTKDFDTHASYATATGIYTVPVTGKYLVTCMIMYASSSATGNFEARIAYNSTDVAKAGFVMWTGVANVHYATVVKLLNCVAGDTISGNAFQSSGGAVLLNADALGNTLSIHRIGL